MKINKLGRNKSILFGSLFFGIIAGGIIILGGLTTKIRTADIIKKFFIVELLFIPLGGIIGYVIENTFKQVKKEEEKKGKIDITIPSYTPKISTSTESTSNIETSPPPSPPEEEVVEEEVGEVELDAGEAPQEIVNNKSEVSTPQEHNINSSGGRVKNLGKYLLVEDKKIINDPEVLAKAIRTMMEKE